MKFWNLLKELLNPRISVTGRTITINASMVGRFEQLVPGEYFVPLSNPNTLMQAMPTSGHNNCMYVHNGIPTRLLPQVEVVPVTVQITYTL